MGRIWRLKEMSEKMKQNLDENHMIQKKHLNEIDFARFVAMLGVLAVHGSSTGVGKTPHDSFMFVIYNALNIWGKLGTATFIFLSSFVLFYTYYERTLDKKLLQRFYKKRLMYIMVPYLVFSVLYYALKMYEVYGFENWKERGSHFFYLLMTGSVHAHLYFVFISVQFYLLFPLFLYIFKKSKQIRKLAIPIGIIIQWVWVYLNHKYFQVENPGSVALSYMMYYMTGAYLGIYYEQFLTWLKDWRKSAYVIGALVLSYGVIVSFYIFIIYLSRIQVREFHTLIHEFAWSTNAFLASITIFIFSHLAQETIKGRARKFILEISAVSFGIYLIHPMLLHFLRKVITEGSPLVFHTWQLVTYLIMFAGSWAIVRLAYNYMPHAWILFGGGKNIRKAKRKDR